MKKMYLFFAFVLMSTFIFAQTRQAASNLSSIKVTKEINNLPSSPKAIVDSLHYDAANAGAIGAGVATYEPAAFFPAAQLSAHNSLGNTITSVKVYINELTAVTSFTLKFYSDQTTVVYSQPFTPIVGWNDIVLTTPFPIPATDLYIAYEIVATGTTYPAGYDQANPANPNGDWIYYSGSWGHLSAFGLNGNWNIRAMVDGTPISTPISSCTPTTWDAGHVQTTNSATSGNFTLSNVGGGTLTCSSVTGVSAPFTCSLVPATVNLANGASVTFTFTYNPTAAGVTNQTAVINTNGGNISITLTGTGIVCTAVNTFPWTEGFEGAYFAPDCWATNDADGDTYNWELRTTWPAHSGTNCAVSASWQGVILTPDNYLITPQISIPATGVYDLTFWACGIDPLYSLEHYSVMVSTTGTAPANFTEIYNETLTADTTWALKTVGLGSYAGQNVYLAFRHWNVSDEYYMRLDDIKVDLTTGISNNNIEAVRVYPNPAKNTLYVSSNSIQSVQIISLTGEVVLTSNKNVVDISKLSQGSYFVKVVTNNNVITEKINVVK